MFRFSYFSAGRRAVVASSSATTLASSSSQQQLSTTSNSSSSNNINSSYLQTSARFCSTTSTPQKEITVDSVWSLWNEGNLFSLSAPDLSQFLSSQNVTVDAAWKKAALVRQVEDVLRAREAKRKQAAQSSSPAEQQQQQQQTSGQQQQGGAPPAHQKESDVYGRWEGQQGGAGSRSEMLLDLSASGFYSQTATDATAAAVPKAFQLFSGNATPDLVLSRVNTTSFPGFAANAECFTFTGADAAQSTKARYSKATQWSILNARHMNLPAEIVADLGKLVLRNDVVRKNRHVVSSFALQQRIQNSSQSMWVSATSTKFGNALDDILKNNGFTIPTNKSLTFETKIRRKNDTIIAELDSKGTTTGVYSAYTNIQTAYWMAPQVGQDIRFLVRTRKQVDDSSDYMKNPILDVASDEAKSLLPVNLGEIIYASENETRTFEKKFEAYSITVTETSRQPLIISRNEDDGVRTELNVIVNVPMQAPAAKFDLQAVTASVYDLSVDLAKAANDEFVSEFGLVADPVVTSTVSA